MPPARLTSNDLPSDLAREYRVMFVRSSSRTTMTVTTDTVREGLAAVLSAQLQITVTVIPLAEAPQDATDAYPSVMAQVTQMHVAVRDVLSTQRSGGSKTSRSPRKPRVPKPE